MSKINIYNMKGESRGKIVLPEIFNIEIKPHLIHKAMLCQESRIKPATAHTKTRGQRRGGGVKPWRQKGTGRARAGSSRSPIWRKGGVVFGPTPKINYQIRISKKEKKLALLSLLSIKAQEKKIIILDKLQLNKIKTKKIEELLTNLKIADSVLLILDSKDEKIIKSARNLPYLKVLMLQNLNILDLLKYEILLITKKGIIKIGEIFKK